jgi:hypothetical protein
MHTVLIIGIGDVGKRLAAGLAAGGRIRRLVLAGRSDPAQVAVAVASTADCLTEAHRVDGTRREQVAELIAKTVPDLVVMSGSTQSPWALADRTDPAARAVAAAGLGVRLPYQLPIPMAVMGAVQDAGYAGPVVNASFPDTTGPILARLGMAPAVGLGNAGMIMMRARAALRRANPDGELPLVRVVANHSQLSRVMASDPPAGDDRPWVFVGEDAKPEPDLAYREPALAPGRSGNQVTAASALPLLTALLPGAPSLRWSAPAPAGLPGGYPVRVADGVVTLDLPDAVGERDAVAFNERMGRGDGIERIGADGTIHFTEACRSALAGVAPDLTEPLPIAELERRARRLDEVLA